MQPIVSIIIPVYNVEDYIEDCLKSVISQTYQGKIECIIVDDCTPDNSCRKIEKILSTYTGNIKFKVIHHEVNKGLSAARNTGIKHATGEWLYFLDSDDELYDYTIEILVNNIDIINTIIIGSHLSISDNKIIENIYKCNSLKGKEIIVDAFVRKNCSIYAWNKLIKRDFIIENNLYFKERLTFEDLLWNFEAFTILENIKTINIPTYKYKIRNNSISTSQNENNQSSIIYILKHMSKTKYLNDIVLKPFIEKTYHRMFLGIISGKMSTYKNYYYYKEYTNIAIKLNCSNYKSFIDKVICYTLNNSNIFNFIILYFITGLIKKGIIKF